MSWVLRAGRVDSWGVKMGQGRSAAHGKVQSWLDKGLDGSKKVGSYRWGWGGWTGGSVTTVIECHTGEALPTPGRGA